MCAVSFNSHLLVFLAKIVKNNELRDEVKVKKKNSEIDNSNNILRMYTNFFVCYIEFDSRAYCEDL